MLDNILDEVFLKTIDQSPKFRSENIKASMNYRRATVDSIIELYELNLVNEVYYQGISTKTYNGSKRSKLKKQEIILIKKIKISEVAKRSFDQVLQEASAYENEFREYFKTFESSEIDYKLVELILADVFQAYFKKIE